MFKKLFQQTKPIINCRNYVKPISELNVRPSEPIQLFDMEAKPITTEEIFADDQNVAVFGVPGAFTPTCSNLHIPSVLQYANELKTKGFTQIICISVNDPFVMKSWAKELGSTGRVNFVSDPEGAFTKHIGAELDLTSKGFGIRSQRYSMIVAGGKVIVVNEDPEGFQRTGAARLLDQWYKHKVTHTL